MGMRSAPVLADNSAIRWVDIPGDGPARVYLHGLGGAAAPYYAGAVAHPRLVGYRSLLVDMLGFGISDRPQHFDYTLESHADSLAAALRFAKLRDVDLVAHSMGGSVGIVLAHRHPELIARLVLVDANLDALEPDPSVAGSAGIASYTLQQWLTVGWERAPKVFDSTWWSTMRTSDPVAVYRSGVSLAAGSTPVMRQLLCELDIPRVFLMPGNDPVVAGAQELRDAGVQLVTVVNSGHCIMLDNPDGFAHAVADALG